MVGFTLSCTGHRIIEAPDGVEALRVLSTQSVDLVITDVNMPKMSGIELTRRLRQLPGYGKTPILLLTTESDPTIKNQGRLAGATGWIVKPFKREQLLEVVSKILPN